MLDLMTAIYNRWVAESLHTTIAELYPAGEGKGAGRNATGTPVDTVLPRAEYELHQPPPTIKTRGSRIAQAVAVIRVWDKATVSVDASTRVATHLSAIYAAYVTADADGMTMANGTILEVEDGGQAMGKADDDVFVGVQTLVIRNRTNYRAA